MDTLVQLTAGFGAVLQPGTLFWLFVGVLVGVTVGVLPGMGAITGMVLLFPIAFTLDPLSGIGMLAAVYAGVMYGDTVGGVLLNMPGNDQAIPATYEGYPMALKGRGGPALVIQAIASFVGGTLGVILLTLLAPYLAVVTRSIGPAEFFLFIVLSLLILAAVVGDQPLKGLISVFVGFSLATIGQDVISGQQRLTFGHIELATGIGFTPITIGLFAVGEVLYGIYTRRHRAKSWVGGDQADISSAFWPNRAEWAGSSPGIIRGSLFGFIIGVLPGVGATVASNGAYAIEKAVARDRSQFGKGSLPGLAAPSAADNAAMSGSMLPTMIMGIPGSAASAVLLTGFIVMGLQPGPLLMLRHGDFAWGVIASMYVANVLLTVVCIFGIPLFARVMTVPYYIIAPVVAMITVMGAYFAEQTMFAVWVMILAGFAGFFMKRFGYSPAALVIAMVLAPLAENSLRQSLIISDGSLTVFFRSGLSIMLAIMVVAVIGFAIVSMTMKQLRN
ncbi:MAG TPA: tripartite tricarboxylate transporter permease, partial [Devosia sp.]|nr:tripartite tricarboxylate transporter permease [Devosia sp.]